MKTDAIFIKFDAIIQINGNHHLKKTVPNDLLPELHTSAVMIWPNNEE